jgi:hypothetical protein
VIAGGVVYALGVLVLTAIFRFVIAPEFAPPALPFAGAALLAVGLAVLALRWTAASAASAPPEPVGSVPSPWLVGLFAFLVADAWFVLLGLPDGLRIGAWVLIPMLLGVALVALVVVLVGRWSAPSRRWTDAHRLALASGALLTSMLYGFFFVTAGNPVDQTGQAIASSMAVTLLAVFARRVRKRSASVGTTVARAATSNGKEP